MTKRAIDSCPSCTTNCAGVRLHCCAASDPDTRYSRRPSFTRRIFGWSRQDRADWRNRAQFFAVASEIMRRILVDRARARKMAKRSGRWSRVTLVEDAARTSPREVDVLDLDAALTSSRPSIVARRASPNSGSSAACRSRKSASSSISRWPRRCATGRSPGRGCSVASTAGRPFGSHPLGGDCDRVSKFSRRSRVLR